MTGLATGAGRVSPERCAQQMALAIRDFINASENAEEWSSMEWENAIDLAQESRRTHAL